MGSLKKKEEEKGIQWNSCPREAASLMEEPNGSIKENDKETTNWVCILSPDLIFLNQFQAPGRAHIKINFKNPSHCPFPHWKVVKSPLHVL